MRTHAILNDIEQAAGDMIMGMQSRMLNRAVIGEWVLATSLGFIFYPLIYRMALTPSDGSMNAYAQALVGTLPFAVWAGIVAGVIQWAVLRRYSDRITGWWPPLTCAGWVLAWIVVLYLLTLSDPFQQWGSTVQGGIRFLLWASVGSIIGACQVWALRLSAKERWTWVGITAGAWAAAWIPAWIFGAATKWIMDSLQKPSPTGPHGFELLIYPLMFMLIDFPIAISIFLLLAVIIGLVTGLGLRKVLSDNNRDTYTAPNISYAE
jgi:hypothetical protein